MKQESIILGSGLKLKVAITSLGEGIRFLDCQSLITFTAGEKSRAYNIVPGKYPGGVTMVDKDTVAISIDTGELDRGDLWMDAVVYVPDTSFTSEFRTEILRKNLNITLV